MQRSRQEPWTAGDDNDGVAIFLRIWNGHAKISYKTTEPDDSQALPLRKPLGQPYMETPGETPL